MTRALTAGMVADIGASSAEKTELLELFFAAGVTRITNASQNLLYNGNTFEAAGGHIEVEGFGESTDESANGCRARFSGIRQDIIASVLGASHRGRKVIIYYAHLDRTTGLFISVVPMFDGYMNESFVVDEDRGEFGGGGVDISTRFTARINEISKRRGVRTNVHSHQRTIPGADTDTFFQNVPGLVNKRLRWGMREPYHGPTVAPPMGPPPSPGGSAPGSGTFPGAPNLPPVSNGGSPQGGGMPGGTGGTTPSTGLPSPSPSPGGGNGWGSTPGGR